MVFAFYIFTFSLKYDKDNSLSSVYSLPQDQTRSVLLPGYPQHLPRQSVLKLFVQRMKK